jgi:hypothetical protein
MLVMIAGLHSPRRKPQVNAMDQISAPTAAQAEALLGHPASYFIVRALIWSAVIVLVFGAIGVARYQR